MYRILCIGNQWRGADDGSLFKAFSRAGHLINIIDNKHFIPYDASSFISKSIRRLGNTFFTNDYNKYLLQQMEMFEPDFICVYKGISVRPETLQVIKRKGLPVICIYPDVSYFDHGSNIPKCIPYYDHIFSTKSFGIEDLKTKFNYSRTTLINHCVDPDIHRIIPVTKSSNDQFGCEVSFIGTYSKKKESVLKSLVEFQPHIDVKIWGNGWERTRNSQVVRYWQKVAILGDLYSLAINASLVNLAILSEQGKNSSSGDLVTSRTFHIPGAGGFMLHERTVEFSELFVEGVEAEAYDSASEMNEKILYYVQHHEARQKIAKAGHDKVIKHHTSDTRAKEILGRLQELRILHTDK